MTQLALSESNLFNKYRLLNSQHHAKQCDNPDSVLFALFYSVSSLYFELENAIENFENTLDEN